MFWTTRAKWLSVFMPKAIPNTHLGLGISLLSNCLIASWNIAHHRRRIRNIGLNPDVCSMPFWDCSRYPHIFLLPAEGLLTSRVTTLDHQRGPSEWIRFVAERCQVVVRYHTFDTFLTWLELPAAIIITCGHLDFPVSSSLAALCLSRHLLRLPQYIVFAVCESHFYHSKTFLEAFRRVQAGTTVIIVWNCKGYGVRRGFFCCCCEPTDIYERGIAQDVYPL